MKLKPIVAAIFMLGLAGSAAAAVPGPNNASVQPQVNEMRDKIIKMEEILRQNQSGGFQHPHDWFSRIAISGEANVDAIWSNRTPTIFNADSSGHTTDLNLTNATFYVDALISDWTRFHGAIRAADDTSNVRYESISNDLELDEAYATIGNFARSMFYARAGRQYVDFGDYDRYPVVESFTQLLSQTRDTAATVGFVHPSGFNGSVFAFQGLPQDSDPANQERVENFGVNLGLANCTGTEPGRTLDYRINVAYLHNMADVDYLASTTVGSSYVDRVHGVSAAGEIKTGPFDAAVHYVTANKEFSPLDVPFVENSVVTRGAEPSAADVGVGFSFLTMEHKSRVGLRYEQTWESAGVLGADIGVFGLPQHRYVADYAVNVSRWTNVTLAVYHDRDYGVSDGGTGDTETTGVLRLGVKFA